MQKLIRLFLFSTISIAIASIGSVKSSEAQPAGEYLDSSSPQTIEIISGNIVTFKDGSGVSRKYYVPDWMFSQYALKVGSSMNLYNRNVIQGVFRDSYIESVSGGTPLDIKAFTIHETRRRCTIDQSPASEGLASGKRVWFKAVCCPSTIPVVGAMWSYQAREIAAVTRPIEPPFVPSKPLPMPMPVERAPIPALW